MNDVDRNKQVIQNFIQAVWINRNLDALKDFWTEDCINHAAATSNNCGLDALRAYHESFFVDFSAFSEIKIDILQQVAEADKVVTYMVSRGVHTGLFFGMAPTDKNVLMSVIRIDRVQDDKIAEHWSVSDAASLMLQLQG